jgi:hypothetical protein
MVLSPWLSAEFSCLHRPLQNLGVAFQIDRALFSNNPTNAVCSSPQHLPLYHPPAISAFKDPKYLRHESLSHFNFFCKLFYKSVIISLPTFNGSSNCFLVLLVISL